MHPKTPIECRLRWPMQPDACSMHARCDFLPGRRCQRVPQPGLWMTSSETPPTTRSLGGCGEAAGVSPVAPFARVVSPPHRAASPFDPVGRQLWGRRGGPPHAEAAALTLFSFLRYGPGLAPFARPHATTDLCLVRARADTPRRSPTPVWESVYLIPSSRPPSLPVLAHGCGCPTLAPSLQLPRSARNRTSAAPTANRRSSLHPLLTRWHAHLLTLLALTSAPRTAGRIPRASIRRRQGGATPRTERDAAALARRRACGKRRVEARNWAPGAVSCPCHSWPQQRLRNGDESAGCVIGARRGRRRRTESDGSLLGDTRRRRRSGSSVV